MTASVRHKNALPVCYIYESKLRACSLALKWSNKIQSKAFERLINNAPLTSQSSSFVSVLDKSKDAVMCTISFPKSTTVVTTLVF